MPDSLIEHCRTQIWPPAGTDARLTAHLEEGYGGKIATVSALDATVYGIDWSDGRRWIARVSPPARTLATTEGDAAILRFLEASQFPAERCATPQPISAVDGRTVLVTERVDGDGGRGARGVGLFRTLGDLLGRLQAMVIPDGPMRRPAGSWHHLSFDGGGREQDIALLGRLLAEAHAIAPARHRALYDPLRERLAELDDLHGLPPSLVHPDFSTANVIVSGEAGPVVIDWMNAGWGPRILSLGTLLMCAGGDTRLVDAIVDSYRQHIQLAPEEIERLPDAVRGFGLIVDCWSAVFRPKTIERIVHDRLAKWYVARTVAVRAQERFRSS